MDELSRRLPRSCWTPALEKLPREALASLQLERLQQRLQHAYNGSPFWRQRMDDAGATPERIVSLSDYSALFPLLRRDDIVAAEQVKPPYGTYPSLDPRLAIRHHQTSGTSGSPPLRVFDTPRDWAWGSDMWATGLWALGVRPDDRALVAFGYGLFIGFWGLHYALEKIGVTTIATGSLDSETRIRLILDQDVSVVACTPTYALRLGLTARELGVDLVRDANVHLVLTSGEPRPEATRTAIAAAFDAFVGDTAGMTEAGTIFMFECLDSPGQCHIIESDFIEEVLDPETLEPVDYGERGVRVMTGLGREGIQVFRYWTNDLVTKVRHDQCPCGRTWDMYAGGIQGRHDDMRKIRGVWFMPVMAEEVIRSFPEVDEFQCLLTTIDALDTLVIEIEPKAEYAERSYAELGEKVRLAIKRSLSLNPRVEVIAPGTLPRYEMKAKRFRDVREAVTADKA